MILDQLENADLYQNVHPGFAAGIEYLRQTDLEQLPLGRHSIDGDRLYVLIAKDPGRGRAGAKLESHRKYFDIQFVIAGDEEMGWKPLTTCQQIDTPHDDARDIAFYGDQAEAWFKVPAGSFAVFFPTDAHAPLAGTGTLHKAVVKVAMEW